MGFQTAAFLKRCVGNCGSTAGIISLLKMFVPLLCLGGAFQFFFDVWVANSKLDQNPLFLLAC